MTLPLMNTLFTVEPLFLPADTEFHSDSPASAQWKQPALQERFAFLRQRCPRALDVPVDGRAGFELFAHFLAVLSAP